MGTKRYQYMGQVGLSMTPGQLVALRAVRLAIPLDAPVYARLEQLGLIARSAQSSGWALTEIGDIVSGARSTEIERVP